MPTQTLRIGLGVGVCDGGKYGTGSGGAAYTAFVAGDPFTMLGMSGEPFLLGFNASPQYQAAVAALSC